MERLENVSLLSVPKEDDTRSNVQVRSCKRAVVVVLALGALVCVAKFATSITARPDFAGILGLRGAKVDSKVSSTPSQNIVGFWEDTPNPMLTALNMVLDSVQKNNRARAGPPTIEEPHRPAGVWRILGQRTECRANINDTTDDGNGTATFIGGPVNSMNQCQRLCERSARCTGVEYSTRKRRCEIWTVPIQHFVRQSWSCAYSITVDRSHGPDGTVHVAGSEGDTFHFEGCEPALGGGSSCRENGWGDGIHILRNQRKDVVGYGNCCGESNRVKATSKPSCTEPEVGTSTCATLRPPAGSWTTLGEGKACRLDKSDRTSDGRGTVYRQKFPVRTIEACKKYCEQKGNCHGVEFNNRDVYSCELWQRRIGAVQSNGAYECHSFTRFERNTSVPEPARIWLTAMNGDGSIKSSDILKEMPTALFHYGSSGLDMAGFDPLQPFQEQDAGASGTEKVCVENHGVHTFNCHMEIDKNADKSRWKGQRVTVHVNTEEQHQTMVGFGAGLTHSSVDLMLQLKKKNVGLYNQLLQRLFGTGDGEAGLTMLRVPIGSSDFSVGASKTYDDVGWDDWGLKYMEPMRQGVAEVLRDINASWPHVKLTGSPWSPPAWMKAHRKLEAENPDNTLRNEDNIYKTYASYLAKVAHAFKEHAMPFEYITLQNEPLFGYAEYAGMYLAAENYARLGRKLKAEIGDSPKILAYDHNWDHPEYPLTAISQAPGVFAGTAWHCYGGHMASAQDEVHSRYPLLETHMTECTGSFPDNKCDISKGLSGFGWNHEWDMKNILLGATSHWASSSSKWIVVTDENCGPVLPQVDFRWGRPLVSLPSHAETLSDLKFNQDFWSLAHMSRFIRPGAKRVLIQKQGESSSLIEAFWNGTHVTLIAMNTDKSNELPLTVTSFGSRFHFTLPKFSTAVMVWQKPAK